MTDSNDHFIFEYLSDCLHVRALGRNFIVEKETAIRTMASMIRSRPIKAALVDLRAVPGPFTFDDRVRLGQLAGRYLLGMPIAVMLTEEQADPERIGKLIARNRGANIEVFLVEAEARVWVQKYLTPAE